MADFVRVRDKKTGHHYSVAVFDPAKHERLPDHPALDRNGRALPAKTNTPIAPPATAPTSAPTEANKKKEDAK